MLFDSTVRKETARSFGLAFVVILTIVVTMLLVRSLGMAAKGSVAPQHVLLSLGYLTLAQLPIMLSLSLFVAVVMSLGRMYKESEMTIWFASGLGLSRFVRPVLAMAWPVMLVVAVLMTIVWPWSNNNSAQLRQQFEQRSDLSRVAPGQFQTSNDGSRVFFIERDPTNEAAARNVFIMSDTKRLESVTTSAEGALVNQGDKRLLVLQHGQRNDIDTANGDKSVARFERYLVTVDDGVMRAASTPPPKTLATLELLRVRGKLNDGELAYRFGMILGCLNLVLLGIGISATNPRRASNWNLLFALLAFIIYFNLINLTQSWVVNGKFKLGSSLLVLHGLAFVINILLLAWRDMGNRLGTPWKRVPPSPPAPPPPPPPAPAPAQPPSAPALGTPLSMHNTTTPGVPA
ncbi:lipopolysaccharide export system permease protein [Roseateles sp. YR242]|uniref:LPS export ABC transporter permease LptF n=1 Tax=Roseateles sp. YR242 TaxID=1855305 RepID=UPI0008CB3FDB|nr:LPS export ABC transporter permease LptF [Roseateles sp. YR242]SEL10438.1 lipopolysaccharide export system permease protein [Roseateles sp. YR242]